MAAPDRIDVAGTPVTVRLRRNPRARRFILRLDKRGDGVVVTLPASARDRDALDFVQRHSEWIRERLPSGTRTVFREGERVPFRGVDHVIQRSPVRRATVSVDTTKDDPILLVGGDPAHLPRRLTDWFKRQARTDLTDRVNVHASALGVKPTRISVRDQTSRWGSCTARGALSFSWRLILAPSDVLDYVCAHEVAHLREMNHSPRFWRHVRDICVHTDDAMAWLKKHGTGLHRIGQ